MKILFNTTYKKNPKQTFKNIVFYKTDKIPSFLKNKLFKKIFLFITFYIGEEVDN